MYIHAAFQYSLIQFGVSFLTPRGLHEACLANCVLAVLCVVEVICFRLSLLLMGEMEGVRRRRDEDEGGGSGSFFVFNEGVT